jgi:hypothetical protein
MGKIAGSGWMTMVSTRMRGTRQARSYNYRQVNCRFAVVAALVLVGCGGGEPKPPPPTDDSMLRGITRIYAIATRDLGRPPQNMDQLKAVLAPVTDDPAKYLRSTRDGEEFVVVWGLNLANSPANTVVAYERKGVDGTRLFVTADGEIREATKEEFDKLKFPKDHTPAG